MHWLPTDTGVILQVQPLNIIGIIPRTNDNADVLTDVPGLTSSTQTRQQDIMQCM